MLERHGVDHDIDWTPVGQALPHRRAAGWSAPWRRRSAKRPRRRDRTVDHRRHLRRPLHRRHLPEVIEIGPVNATIHKIDECIAVADIEPLSRIYQRTLDLLL
jgi:succinyl-diaminopimelate desuccinylase